MTYTDASQVKTETTTAADATALSADGYTYDAHGNVATHTIDQRACPRPPQARHRLARRVSPPRRRARPAKATTATTATASYGYDAYNRLISSAVYPGATAAGTPDTRPPGTPWTPPGDVTGQDTTTSSEDHRHTVNTIDHRRRADRPHGQRRAAASQTFDTDGNVTTDLAGDTYTYTLAGAASPR